MSERLIHAALALYELAADMDERGLQGAALAGSKADKLMESALQISAHGYYDHFDAVVIYSRSDALEALRRGNPITPIPRDCRAHLKAWRLDDD